MNGRTNVQRICNFALKNPIRLSIGKAQDQKTINGTPVKIYPQVKLMTPQPICIQNFKKNLSHRFRVIMKKYFRVRLGLKFIRL